MQPVEEQAGCTAVHLLTATKKTRPVGRVLDRVSLFATIAMSDQLSPSASSSPPN